MTWIHDAALAEPDAKPEPVAWMYVNLEGECEQIEYETPPAGDDSITPLYAAPPAAAKPEPATDEQAAAAYDGKRGTRQWVDFRDGWLHAERFHGIGGSK